MRKHSASIFLWVLLLTPAFAFSAIKTELNSEINSAIKKEAQLKKKAKRLSKRSKKLRARKLRAQKLNKKKRRRAKRKSNKKRARNSSVSKISVAKKSSVKDFWGFTFYTENYKSAADHAANLSSYNLLMLKYNIDKVSSATFLESFVFDWGESGTFSQGDVAFQYDRKLGKAAGLDLSTRARLYVPVSESSQDLGRYQLRLYGNAGGEISPILSYKFQTNPRIYTYSDHDEGQLTLKWINAASLTLKATDKISLTSSLGHIHYSRNSGLKYEVDKPIYLLDDPYDNDDAMFISLEAGFALGITNFSLMIEQERDLRSSESSSLFDESGTTYFMTFSVSI